MTDQERTLLVLGVLAVLCAAGIASLVLIARSLRGVSSNMQRIHLQQVTIVRMLLRAGFRPARNGGDKDWFDNALQTQQVGDIDYTAFDWRTPPGEVKDRA